MVLALATLGCGRLAPDASDAGDSDAAPTDAAVADAGPDVDPNAPPLGTIVAQELQAWTMSGTSYRPFVLAWFSPSTTVTTGGTCIPTHPTAQCGYPPTCTFAWPTANAGNLTVAGGMFGSGVDVPQWDVSSLPYDFDGKTKYQGFTAGDVLTATGTGAEVPAFTAQVTVPANITLLTPKLPFDEPSGQDLTFTWSGGESGDHVSIFFDNEAPIQADCTFDATAGTGTIPHEALAGVTGQVNVSIMVVRDAKTWVGGYPIDFQMQRTTNIQITFQ